MTFHLHFSLLDYKLPEGRDYSLFTAASNTWNSDWHKGTQRFPNEQRRTSLQGQADQNKQFFITLTNSICKHNKNRPKRTCFPHSASASYETSVCHTTVSKDSISAPGPAKTFQSRYHVTIGPDTISEQNNDWNLKKDKNHDHAEHRKISRTLKLIHLLSIDRKGLSDYQLQWKYQLNIFLSSFLLYPSLVLKEKTDSIFRSVLSDLAGIISIYREY